MLSKNTKLRMLDLGGCSIGIDGFLALMHCLAKSNTTLETLGLEDCRVSPPPQQQTIHSLANMLFENNTLRQLYLGKHGLSDYDLEVRVRRNVWARHEPQPACS
jgi:hypothetical protein